MMQCHMSDTYIHKFNIEMLGSDTPLIGKTAMKTSYWKYQLLGESRSQKMLGTGHFFGPFCLQSSTKEGLCNPESSGNESQGFPFFRILCSHYHNATKANTNKCIDSPFSVSNIESCVKYAPGTGLSTGSPTPGWKFTQQRF